MEHLTISWGYLIGAGMLLVTLIILNLTWRFWVRKVFTTLFDDVDDEQLQKSVGMMFGVAYAGLTVGTLLLMLWTGYGFHEQNPTGAIEVPRAGSLEHEVGRNAPEVLSDKLKEDALTGQREGGEAYKDWRENYDALTPKVEREGTQ